MNERYRHVIGIDVSATTVASGPWEAGETAVAMSRAQYVTKSQDVALAARLEDILAGAVHTAQAIAIEKSK